jgi:hypothetical protein
MLIEELFARGVMTMGPSRIDPARQVGVFRPEAVAHLPAERAAEMEKFRWLEGQWKHENRVPATALSPAYVDIGSSRFEFCEKDAWLCIVDPSGVQHRHITYDPLSRQWIYVLTRGSFGILRSREGWAGGAITFSGRMTMVGIDCEWRMTWTRLGDDSFRLTNEEQLADGSWAYIDEWRFTREPVA